MFSHCVYSFWLQVYTTLVANTESLCTAYVNFYAHKFYMHQCKNYICTDALTMQA